MTRSLLALAGLLACAALGLQASSARAAPALLLLGDHGWHLLTPYRYTFQQVGFLRTGHCCG